MAKNKLIHSIGAFSFTIVLLLLIPLNILILTHTMNYHTHTEPCDGRWLEGNLNPEDNNNVCILTPEYLKYKKTVDLVENGILGNKRPGCVYQNNDLNGGRNKDQSTCEDTTVNTWNIQTIPKCSNVDYNTKIACENIGTWSTDKNNNLTGIGKIDPTIDENGMVYTKETAIVSLCRYNDYYKTCSNEPMPNKVVPDICLFTGFEELNKDGKGLKFVAEEWGLGSWGSIFTITAITLSSIHLLCSLLSRPCGGYCNCFNSFFIGLKGFPCCASKYLVETGCPCAPVEPRENVKLGIKKYDSCSQCGALTFLTIWTMITFFFFTMVGENIIMEQCYGVKHTDVYDDGTAQDFIESSSDGSSALNILQSRQMSYTIIIVLQISLDFFFLIGLFIWACTIQSKTMQSHYLVQGVGIIFNNELTPAGSRQGSANYSKEERSSMGIKTRVMGMTYNRINKNDIELNSGLKF
jgi:hypothetical protein